MASPYLIPLQDAVNWTTNWRTANANSVKAFKMDAQEILDILAEIGSTGTGIRLYFGLENGAEKLVLVGIDNNGNDIINPVVKGQQISGTYDFNQPCPPTCDVNSPLYTGDMPA